MAYDPEKTKANTSGNQKPAPQRPTPDQARKVGQTILGGKKK